MTPKFVIYSITYGLPTFINFTDNTPTKIYTYDEATEFESVKSANKILKRIKKNQPDLVKEGFSILDTSKVVIFNPRSKFYLSEHKTLDANKEIDKSNALVFASFQDAENFLMNTTFYDKGFTFIN